jgi:hypothetical protein
MRTDLLENWLIWEPGEFEKNKNLITWPFLTSPKKKIIYSRTDQVLITSWENWNGSVLTKKWEPPNTRSYMGYKIPHEVMPEKQWKNTKGKWCQFFTFMHWNGENKDRWIVCWIDKHWLGCGGQDANAYCTSASPRDTQLVTEDIVEESVNGENGM